MPEKLTIKAPAKVNLSLRIIFDSPPSPSSLLEWSYQILIDEDDNGVAVIIRPPRYYPRHDVLAVFLFFLSEPLQGP